MTMENMHVNGVQAEQIRQDIARARAELGQTLQVLAARADVRSRAKESAGYAAERVRAAWLSPGPWVAMSMTLAAAALVVTLVRGRRR